MRARRREQGAARPLWLAGLGAVRLLLPRLLCALHLAAAVGEAAAQPCSTESELVGFRGDLRMLQHQLRGTVRVVDDCTFRVDSFDMLEGPQVYWWAALSESLQDMLQGWPVSEEPLVGRFNSQTLVVKLENTSWNDMGILAVWSKATASNYGYVVLEFGTQGVNDKDGQGDDYSENGDPRGDEGESSLPHDGEGVGAGGNAPSPSSLPLSPAAAPGPSPTLGPLPQPSLGSPFLAPPPPSLPEKLGQWQPTMFENCLQLSHRYRVRWTLNKTDSSVDLGLEAAVDFTKYIGFGWAEEANSTEYMMNSDMIIAGFDEKGTPFAEDYFVTARAECNWDSKSPSGVCPDSFLGGGNSSLNNVELIWGQHVDGVTLIRIRVPLLSPDLNFDHSENLLDHHTIIWAIGNLRPPDSRTDRMTPMNHGNPEGGAYGVGLLSLDLSIDDCQSVLEPAADFGLVLTADRGSEFIVTSGDAVHYPNPPSFSKSLCVNGHEAPVIKVERGVPVQFSVQAGHDVSLYVTSDPIGGRLNHEEVIYAGGEDAHGVPAAPYLLLWTPNSRTPDLVYYQAYGQPKMGWKVEVVDGGLSDMYTNSASLAGDKVTLFWTLRQNDISFAVRGERASGYLGLAFGSGMVNSFAYVGWLEDGVGKVATYFIDAREAGGVHNWTQELTLTKCLLQGGQITFEFSRALKPGHCGTRCNVIDPQEPLKVLWCMGTSWTEGTLTNANMHSSVSSKATLIHLQTGTAEVEMLQPVFAVHGFMMFIAWGILMPSGVLSARYLRSFDWFGIHVYAQCAGITVAVLGLLFAVGELQGFDFSTTHSKIGLVALLIGLWQPLNAFSRPPKPSPGERPRMDRVVWQWTHIVSGRVGLAVAALALISGLVTLESKYGGEGYTAEWLAWGALGWFLALGALAAYLERRSQSERWRENEVASSDWRAKQSASLRRGEEEATQDLLQSDWERGAPLGKRSPSRQAMAEGEVEMEPLQLNK